MSWTIKGQAGKAMNATARTLEDLNIADVCALEFQSLGEDSLSWTAKTEDATGSGTIIPEVGQTVELLDYMGDRVFKGHVALPAVGISTVSVKAVGPWWWMERIALSGNTVDS